MSGPLKGINVLSFGRVLAGPYTAMLLADLGADVIKIETGKEGDMARKNGPFIDDLSSYFLSVNRGKKSFSLNIRHEKGVDILKRLVRQMDILIENFRPGVMRKMGLDYDVAIKLNPRLIYVSVSGFGQSGPYSSKTAFDMVAQGMGGTVSITGEPGRPPVRVGYSIGDMGAALFAATATLAALYERTQSGVGQLIDVAMMDSQVALCENACARYMATGEVPKPIGARHPLVTPFQVFPTKTDEMVVVAFTDEQWENLCHAVDREDFADDARFRTMSARNENHVALESTLSEVFRRQPREAWLSRFEQFEVTAGPVNNIEQVVNDPHVKARDMVLEVAHDRLGRLKVVGTPMKFSRTPCEITNASPDLGRHTEEILAEKLGLSQDEIDKLREEGVVDVRRPGSK